MHVAMHSLYCCSLQCEEEFGLRKGPPCDLFCPALDPPLVGYGRNLFMHVNGHDYFIRTKCGKHPSSGSVVMADHMFTYIYMH